MNKRLISSMRIGLALFLSVFGTNLLPVATAYATHRPSHDPAVVEDQTCDDVTTPGSGGWTEKFDEGYGDTVEYTAPSGYLVDKYCVKAGSTQQGNGPEIISVDPPSATVTIDYPDKDSISHYVVHLVAGSTKVAIPNPSPVDPCGPDNASWTLPADTDSLDWSLVGGVLSVQTKTGYVFTDDTTSKSFGAAQDSEEACPPDEVGIPNPTPNDPCGLRNASWTLPDDTDSLDWSLVGGVLSVETKAGYVFTDGTTSKNFGLAEDSNELCPEEGNPDLNFDYDEKCTEEEESDGEASVEIENEGDAAANNLTVVLRDSEGNLLDIVYDVDVAADDEEEVIFTDLDLGFYTIEVWDGETMLGTEEVEVDECGGGFPVDDVCLNIDGIQTEVPEGYVKDGDNCARVLGSNDVCPNITGTQTTVPAGMVKDQQGNCVTDICPNVTGIQTSLPAGYTQVNGQCVAPVGGQGQVLGTTLPAALPVTGSTDIGSGQLLSIIVGFFTYLFLSYRNRKLEA